MADPSSRTVQIQACLDRLRGGDESAEVLGVSERTVKRRWQAARLKLHEALHGEVPE
jgi:DNA-directed RNA polymerase specialized sigma24 family protein